MIKAALIGTSGYAALYLKILLEKHDLGAIVLSDIISIHSHHEEELNAFKNKGIDFHDDLSQFFSAKKDIDLLCIPTSIASHYEIAKLGLEVGYNLLLEKPAAATLKQIAELKEIAAAKGLMVYVGYQNLYEPETWHIKERILAGDIGKVKSVDLLGLWPRSEDYFKRNEWAGKVYFENKPVFDSVMHNAFAHFVNLALFWTGTNLNESNTTIGAKGKLARAYSIESFDTASVILETKNAIEIRFNISHACAENFDPIIRINGTSGSIFWAGNNYEINDEKHQIAGNANEAIERARLLMFDSVLDLISGKGGYGCTLSQATSLTETVGLLHDELEIDTLAFTEKNTDHGKQRVINGIDKMMKVAFEKGETI